MQSTIKCFLVFSLLNVASCGIIKDRSTEYADAKEGEKLVIPAGYSTQKINPRYPIPDIENARSIPDKFELPEPPNATAALDNEPFIIETVNDQTWLHLYTAPGKVWPLLDFFWAKYGVKVRYEEIAKGFLVTEPLISSDGSSALKTDLLVVNNAVSLTSGVTFQARLNQGIRRNTAELQIRVLNRGLTSSAETTLTSPAETTIKTQAETSSQKAKNEWQTVSGNVELEQAMLTLIGQYVTSDTLDNRHSLLANDIGGESKVRLLRGETGDSYLELMLSFDRAWSEIKKALTSAEVLVSDFDRSVGTYYISYIQEDDMSAWYDVGSSEIEKRKEKNISVQLEETEEGKTIVRVKILNQAFDVEQQEELINLIFEHIS
jgi:uncharacterized lipoprotein